LRARSGRRAFRRWRREPGRPAVLPCPRQRRRMSPRRARARGRWFPASRRSGPRPPPPRGLVGTPRETAHDALTILGAIPRPEPFGEARTIPACKSRSLCGAANTCSENRTATDGCPFENPHTGGSVCFLLKRAAVGQTLAIRYLFVML